MKKYRLLMHGQNFLIRFEDRTDRYGFYQNFFLEAATLQQAKLMASSKIWHDRELKEITLNPESDPPKITLETYWELDSSDYLGKHLITERTFYRQKKWWQFWKKSTKNGY